MYNQPPTFRNTPKNFTDSFEKLRNTVLSACFVVLSGIGAYSFQDNIKNFTNTLDTFGPDAAIEQIALDWSEKNSNTINKEFEIQKSKINQKNLQEQIDQKEITNKLIDLFCEVFNVQKNSREMFDLMEQGGLIKNDDKQQEIKVDKLTKIISGVVFIGTSQESIELQKRYTSLKKSLN
jgi:hypothetical protein